MAKKVTRRDVDRAAADYAHKKSVSYGGHDEAVINALMRWQDAQAAYEKQNKLEPGSLYAMQKNPVLMTLGNPGELMGTDVLAVVYRHKKDGKLYCHGFGDADIELKSRGDSLTITALAERTGVKMFAMPDGSVRIMKPGSRVWEDL